MSGGKVVMGFNPCCNGMSLKDFSTKEKFRAFLKEF